MARCTFFVQVEPEYSDYQRDADGEPKLAGIRAKRLTQNRSSSPVPSSVTVKLTVEIPDGAFKPLRPEAVIVIPENYVQVNESQVMVEPLDANDS